jgi:hypothetical protein
MPVTTMEVNILGTFRDRLARGLRTYRDELNRLLGPGQTAAPETP